MRLRTFSRRSGSMAAKSRTSLSRVLHFAYLLQPMPIARSTEMIQTVISVLVTREIKKQNVLATTQQLLSHRLTPGLSQPSRLAQRTEQEIDAYFKRRLATGTAPRDHKECIRLRSIDRNASW
jgi:hypothetical protein